MPKPLCNEDILKIILDDSDSGGEDGEYLNDLNGALVVDDNMTSDSEPDNIINNDDLVQSDDETAIAAPAVTTRQRRMLNVNRLVNNLDSSLNPSNYDSILPPQDKETYDCVMVKAKKTVPAEILTWTNEKRPNIGRQGRENVITTQGGLINDAKDCNTHVAAFSLFMTEEILDIIVEKTNCKIDIKVSQINLDLVEPKNIVYLKRTTRVEITAFIGMLYARGLLGLNHHDYKLLFNDSIAHPFFGAFTTCNRYFFCIQTYHLTMLLQGQIASLMIDLQQYETFSKNSTIDAAPLCSQMNSWRWMRLYMAAETKSLSNNITVQNHKNMDCCSNQ